ncbi:ATP-binding protein [Oceaniglobus ichthyenteri]|uniref:ATP-binding protein n=1 Tax=Oceaniglobus ichthyenteri TaxID=2136177 RepID=UPI000D3BA810|nr:ATP-binding protein [Oceaniglobus ichthyenteri]
MDINAISQVLNALHLPAVFVDHDDRIALCNPEALGLFGAGAVGRHYAAILRQPLIIDAIETVQRGNGATRARYLGTQGPAETVWMASAAPLMAAGQPGVLISFEDRTAAQEADEMRRDFVANVSHELRTPLTALNGFIETLRGAAKDDADARERFLGIMAHEATRMNRLVQDLLSLSRVESEERMRPKARISLSDVLNSAIVSLTPLAEQRGVSVTVEGAADLPIVVGDGDQLRQVFQNLIENAVKYGGDGKSVVVRAGPIARDPSLRSAAVKIDVIDQGIGINPLHIPRLTERFYRVDSHRAREMGGTGLGLAIVKHILNRHRGRLRIESEPGEGSTFSVLLPVNGD